jgi:hypothetical protein
MVFLSSSSGLVTSNNKRRDDERTHARTPYDKK